MLVRRHVGPARRRQTPRRRDPATRAEFGPLHDVQPRCADGSGPAVAVTRKTAYPWRRECSPDARERVGGRRGEPDARPLPPPRLSANRLGGHPKESLNIRLEPGELRVTDRPARTIQTLVTHPPRVIEAGHRRLELASSYRAGGLECRSVMPFDATESIAVDRQEHDAASEARFVDECRCALEVVDPPCVFGECEIPLAPIKPLRQLCVPDVTSLDGPLIL